MKSICIFCGSSLGSNPIFQQIAQATGEAIAKQGRPWFMVVVAQA